MYKYSVVKSQGLSPTALALTLRPTEPGRRMAFKPGQYAAIHFQNSGRPTVVRCFSMSSSPGTEEIEFGLRVTGTFTYTAALLQPGDIVKIRGPFGDFTLGRGLRKDLVFFAGGIGITPFMSMLRYAARYRPDRRIALIYSVSDQTDAPYSDELIALSRQNPNLTVIFCVTRGPADRFAGSRVIQGRITQDVISRLIKSPDQLDYFICGPTPMLKTIQKSLRARGADPAHIFVEDFAHSGGPVAFLFSPLNRRLFAGTAATLVVGFLGIMALDMKATLAKAELTTSRTTQAANLPASTPAPTIAPPSTPSPSDTPVPTAAATPDPTPQATPTPAQTPAATYQQPSTTYQQPVSAVS